MTPTQARNKIKNHLAKFGRYKNFTVTPRLVKQWWNVINTAIFNNILPDPLDIQVKHLKDCYGECEHFKRYGCKIVLKIDKDMADRNTFINTLTHEMVHAYEQLTYGRMTHGETFFEWEDTIKKQINVLITEKD